MGDGKRPLEQPRIEHEHGHDAVVLAVRGGEGRVVVDAQVAPEPDDGGASPPGYGRAADVDSTVALVRDFPLFPLGLVALPTELVPLHIFEERYKTMVARVLEEEGEFGIVWVADDGLRDVGCACEIAEVLERMPDGRMNLVARGTRPFRIEARQDELAYPAGTIEFLDGRGRAGRPRGGGGGARVLRGAGRAGDRPHAGPGRDRRA